jgi:hypothetical protein
LLHGQRRGLVDLDLAGDDPGQYQRVFAFLYRDSIPLLASSLTKSLSSFR